MRVLKHALFSRGAENDIEMLGCTTRTLQEGVYILLDGLTAM